MARILRKNFSLLIWGFLISFFIFSPFISHAQDVNELMINLVEGTPVLPQADLIGIIFRIIQYVLMFVGVVAVVILIYGGFLWMTARGNDEQVNKAKKVLVNGLIGLVVVLLSYAIVSFVIGPLISGGGGGGSQGGAGGGPPGFPKGFNYLVVTSRYPQDGETTARNVKIIITFNQNLLEKSVRLARPLPSDPTQTTCLKNGQPDWTVAIQNQDNKFIDGSLQVNGNSLVFVPTGECPEPLNAFQCEGTNGQPCSLQLKEAGCCGCFEPLENYKITLIARRGTEIGLKGMKLTGNTMYRDEIWKFNVGNYIDSVAPAVETNLPQGTNVARNVGIQVTFTKEVDLTTLKIYNPSCVPGSATCTVANCGVNECLNYAVDDLDKATVKIFQVDDQGNPILNGEVPGFFEKLSTKAFLFRPSSYCPEPAEQCRCLPSLTNLKVILDEREIRGANCFALNCANGKCDWQFRTSDVIDLDPPTVRKTYPENQAKDVERLLEIKAEFEDESGMDVTSINEDTFILWPTIAPRSIETINDISTFIPSRVLEAQTNYFSALYGTNQQRGGCDLGPDMAYGIKDLAGNTMIGNYLWSYLTGWLVNGGEPYIDRVSPSEGPKGECVTVHGYNLGCCSPFACSINKEAQEKQWNFKDKNCQPASNLGLAQFYAGELNGLPQYVDAEVLTWEEIKKPDKCLFGQCPSNCSLNTCPDSCSECKFCSDSNKNNCGTCWCPMPLNYSPENEIIVVVPDEAKNRLDYPGQVKIIPAYE